MIYDSKNYTPQNLDNSFKLEIGLNYLNIGKISEVYQITSSQMKEAISKTLGSNVTFKNENFYTSECCQKYEYNSNSQIYKLEEFEGGGDCPGTIRRIYEATQKDNQIIIKEKFREFSSDIQKRCNSRYDDSCDISDFYSTMSTIKYTFVSKNGNYIFVSSEIIN